MTGFTFLTTSLSKFSSVTTLVAPTVGAPSDVSGWLRLMGVEAESGLVVRLVRQPPLGVDRSGTSGARRGHRLAVRVVDYIPAGEHAVHAGAGGRVLDAQVPLVVHLQLADEQLAPGVVADSNEDALNRKGVLLARLGVAQPQAGDLALAKDLGDLAVPAEVDQIG